MPDREFDLILFGASGFTGRQAAKYLSLKVPAGLKWAIAGRDRMKLEALQAGVPAFVADSSRPSSIDDFVRRTRIVISTAGPFELYSDAVVDACARLRTHYLDITGETFWVRSLIERYHQMAVENGTRLIPFCGFDSVPADLGAIWIVEQLGGDAREVKAFYQFKGGTPNGGTIATGFHAFASGDRTRLGDLFLLSPETARKPWPVESDPSHAAYDPDVRAWVAPFLMSAINTRVVRRSCSLLGLDFAYQEYMKVNGPMQAKLFAGLSEVMKKSMEWGRSRRVLERASPKPGSGPSERAMDSGWFRCELFARSSNGHIARGVVSGSGDPANRITVKCLCESALTLACEEGATPKAPGVLTPATGLGEPLRRRLESAGICFDLSTGEGSKA